LAYNINIKEISYYYTIDNKCPYLDWFNDLDFSIQVRVNKRVKKLREGTYGDHKPLQKSELSELRMDFGKGYRVYYYDLDNTVILFVAGSEKKDQKKVIQKANQYFEDYKERAGYDTNS
jgi:putative addiction module killer protein